MSSLPVRDKKDQPRRKSASAPKVQSPPVAIARASQRSVTIFQPVGCISVTTGKKFAQQLEHSEDRLIDFSAVQHEQVLVQRPQGTQQSLDESVGKLRKGRPPNQLRVRYAMPMSLPGRGKAPSL
jgi:hypothetical protein